MPAQSAMPGPPAPAAQAALSELAARVASLHAASGGDLLECFGAVPDPRDPRGIRHPLAWHPGDVRGSGAVRVHQPGRRDRVGRLGRAGDPGRRWVPPRRRRGSHPAAPGHDRAGAHRVRAPAARRSRRGVPGPPGRAWARSPSRSLRRCCSPRSRWTARRSAAPPGRTGSIPYLLAAATHESGRGDRRDADRPEDQRGAGVRALLRALNERVLLAGHVITIDAGHTVRAHASFICERADGALRDDRQANTPGCIDAHRRPGLGIGAGPARD